MAHRAAALAEWQFVDLFEPPNATEPLLAHLRAFCFPCGEDAARQIRAVRITEKGEIRSSPQTRWIPFDAEQTIDASSSSFCWNSHFHTARILPVTVTDACEVDFAVRQSPKKNLEEFSRPPQMTLTINGENHEFSSMATLSDLVTHLGMKPDRVAIELNRELIPRDRWSATQLSNGDKLEIVHFVGGGREQN